jgi:aminoglycoside phosphotransferase family enzyme
MSANPTAAADPGLEAKVAFLLGGRGYPETTTGVTAIETHMSWVFLTDRYAYKLKKPVHFSYLDFSTEEARRKDCMEELRLNRRLTSGVYIEVAALTLDKEGKLRISSENGAAVDWLVKMRRLPAQRMLDVMIREHRVGSDDIRSVAGMLSRFYLKCVSVKVSPGEYRKRLADTIAEHLEELSTPAFALPAALVGQICARQRDVLDRCSALFDERATSGKIVEGHGDLRPEHICVEAQPQIIDCLEFSRDFRVLDRADELAFLALECERLGAPELKALIFEPYGELTGDRPHPALVHFYQSHRACLRAKMSIWHLKDPALRASPKWPAQARDYLRLAHEHIEQCLC